MRKILLAVFLFVFLLACSVASFAQKQLRIKAGITQSGVKMDFVTPNLVMKNQSGFQIGASYDVWSRGNFIFQPAVQLTQKGYKAITGNPSDPFYWNRDLLTTYVEVPLTAVYKAGLSKSSSFYIGTGPVLSYGLFGRLKATYTLNGLGQQPEARSNTDKKVFEANGSRRFDLGWSFSAGIEYRRFNLNIAYNHGLMTIEKNTLLKNRNTAITLGYVLRQNGKHPRENVSYAVNRSFLK